MKSRLPVLAVIVFSLTAHSLTTTPSNALAQETCRTPVASDAQRFSGSTATVTDPFTVESGILKVSGTHEGNGNFAVVAYSQSDYEDLVFNEIGPYSGEAALQVEPGTTLILDVEADGPWVITVESAFGSG